MTRTYKQGSKKAPLDSPTGISRFFAGKVTFKAYTFPMGEDPGMSSSIEIIHQDKQEVALSRQNVRAACPAKNKLEIKFFFLALTKSPS